MTVTEISPPRNQKWRKLFSYLAGLVTGLPVAVFLIMSRETPLTRVSVAGFVLAACMSFGVGYVLANIALRLPVYPEALHGKTDGWLYRPWVVVIQMMVLALGGAGIALR